MNIEIPVFLGVAQRAVRFQVGWDLSRLSTFVFAPFFPIRIPDIALVLGVPSGFASAPKTFELNLTTLRRNELVSTITVRSTKFKAGVTQEYFVKELAAGPQVLLPTKPAVEQAVSSIVSTSALYSLFVLPSNGFQALEPTQIRIDHVCEGVMTALGHFSIEFLKTPPLTPEEVKEIRSRQSQNVATFRINCKGCGSTELYAPINPGDKFRSEHRSVAIASLGDRFVCECGTTHFETLYLKLGVHEIFRQTNRREVREIKLMSCYQPTSLSSIVAQYKKLIAGTPPEEKVQVFLTENPIMWSFLGSLATFPKPRLSTHLTADFAVLTPTKTLYFIELEKPQTSLAKAKGGQSAELQAGKDQIDTWRTWINDHRRTVLEELQVAAEQVHSIKYILVAGMSSETKQDDLRAIREGMREDTQFYTFDELAGFVQCFDRTTRDM